MSSEKLFEYYDQALDLEGTARKEFLAKIAIEAPELAQELNSLISSYEENESFLEKPIIHQFGHISNQPGMNFDPVQDHFIGRNFGPYVLVKTLGHGGMGAVYLGERQDGSHERKVAIKLLNPIHGKQLRLRFQTEQQILANLSHPNIARLYDSGVTEDGLPFYIMEYVEGKHIDRYMDENKMTISDRLNLFLKVCDAVQYAHQNLIVHRFWNCKSP